MMKYSKILCGAAALAMAASSASAQWSENFDSYPEGPLSSNGWDGWDGSAGAYGEVDADVSRSAPNSMRVNLNMDAVYHYNGAYTSGQWVYTAHVFLPGNLDDNTYFIIQNEYAHFGPYDWTVQVTMDPFNGNVIETIQDVYGGFSAFADIVFDEWVEIRCEWDFDANNVKTYYNEILIGDGDINIRAGGPIECANLDLYGPQSGPAYYDDLTMEEAGGSCYADYNGDGNVNTQDFLAYLGAWSAAFQSGNYDEAADCNGDGSINTQDFLCFLGLWAAGC